MHALWLFVAFLARSGARTNRWRAEAVAEMRGAAEAAVACVVVVGAVAVAGGVAVGAAGAVGAGAGLWLPP